MSRLKIPIISAIVGEGGSGGALAIGVADRVLMLEYAVYSVISPEGCASILWKSAEKASVAADAMGITADRLLEFGLIDEIVPEPLGSAHRDPEATAQTLQNALVSQLRELESLGTSDLLSQRAARLESMGVFKGT